MYPAKSDAKAPLCDQHAAFESWDGFVTAMMNEADGDLGITLEDLHPVAGAADVAPALTIAGVKADYQAATLNYLRALSATPAMGIPGATRCEYEGNNLDPSQPARIMAEIKSVLERSRISLTVAGTSLDKLRSRAIEVIKDLLAKRRAGVPSSEAAKEQERTVDTSNDYEIQELMNAYLIVRDDVGATVDEDLAIRDANAGP
jgi:hypothetical protein